jgi:CheY-like chemotaxis protein
VLLVEDNPDVATASIGLLSNWAVRSLGVGRGGGARGLECNGIDLVFSDIVMPGKMDGLGLARHQGETSDLPVCWPAATATPRKMRDRNFRSCASPIKFTS